MSRGAIPYEPHDVWQKSSGLHFVTRTTIGWHHGWQELYEFNERSIDRATWADFDHRGGFAFARDGKLFVDDREVADFNDFASNAHARS